MLLLSKHNSLKLAGKQLKTPTNLSSHGHIWFSVRSHVTPEVFFGAEENDRDKEAGQHRHKQMMVKSAPTAAFEVVQPQVVFGPLKVLLNIPARATQAQTTGGRGRSIQMRQIIMVGLRFSLWPVRHQPHF